MTAYVDPAVFTKPRGRKCYCHLAADSVAELHAFALHIGLGRHFFHAGANHVHYDVPEELRRVAIAAGAVEISSRALVRLARPVRRESAATTY